MSRRRAQRRRDGDGLSGLRQAGFHLEPCPRWDKASQTVEQHRANVAAWQDRQCRAYEAHLAGRDVTPRTYRCPHCQDQGMMFIRQREGKGAEFGPCVCEAGTPSAGRFGFPPTGPVPDYVLRPLLDAVRLAEDARAWLKLDGGIREVRNAAYAMAVAVADRRAEQLLDGPGPRYVDLGRSYRSWDDREKAVRATGQSPALFVEGLRSGLTDFTLDAAYQVLAGAEKRRALVVGLRLKKPKAPTPAWKRITDLLDTCSAGPALEIGGAAPTEDTL